MFRARLPAVVQCGHSRNVGKMHWHVRDSTRVDEAPYVRHSTGRSWRFLVLDVDRPGAAGELDALMVPPPLCTVTNPESGHAHFLYPLRYPVRRASRAQAAIYEAVRASLEAAAGADTRHRGPVTFNPLWSVRDGGRWIVEWYAPVLLELGDLTEYVTRTAPKVLGRVRGAPTGRAFDGPDAGRNCFVFLRTSRYAYPRADDARRTGTLAQWSERVHGWAHGFNAMLTDPLPRAEVDGIGRSITQWTWEVYEGRGRRDSVVQAARGRASGRARRSKNAERDGQIVEMAAQGHSQRLIARALRVSRGSVIHASRQRRARASVRDDGRL